MEIKIDGIDEVEITLTNEMGFSVTLNSKGAGVKNIVAPNLDGKYSTICNDGFTIGRIEKDLKKNKICVDEKEYEIHDYDEEIKNTNFQYEINKGIHFVEVVFSNIFLESKTGIPGDLALSVIYTVFDDFMELVVEHEANTTKNTVLNIGHMMNFSFANKKDYMVVDNIDENPEYLPLKNVNETHHFGNFSHFALKDNEGRFVFIYTTNKSMNLSNNDDCLMLRFIDSQDNEVLDYLALDHSFYRGTRYEFGLDFKTK